MYRLVLGVEGGGKSFAAWMDLPGRLRVRFRPWRRGGVVRVCYRSMVTGRDCWRTELPGKVDHPEVRTWPSLQGKKVTRQSVTRGAPTLG